ncbi:MAG: hypothetical protein EP343_01315 [Deltaproteobacteria bacterium]|nr:MAG: hypothetical protein EP343_01315 [Deltaproteobacteria bacterium]
MTSSVFTLPSGPWGPAGPRSPLGPAGPWGPWFPAGPRSPWSPWGPGLPGMPQPRRRNTSARMLLARNANHRCMVGLSVGFESLGVGDAIRLLDGLGCSGFGRWSCQQVNPAADHAEAYTNAAPPDAV